MMDEKEVEAVLRRICEKYQEAIAQAEQVAQDLDENNKERLRSVFRQLAMGEAGDVWAQTDAPNKKRLFREFSDCIGLPESVGGVPWSV